MERREYHRAPLAFPIRLIISDLEKFTDQFASDISAGGIFLQMNSPQPQGANVDLEFYLEPAQKTIRFQGEVVRSVTEGAEDGSPPGMGIRFIDLGEEARRFIELVVQKHDRQHPAETGETPDRVAGDEAAESIPPIEEETSRTKIDLHLLFRFPEDEAFHEGQGHTLQDGEIFVLSDNLRPPGTRVFLQVFLAEEDKWIPVQGEVTRAMYSSGTEGVLPGLGFGVAIHRPSEEILRVLQSA